MVDSAVNLSFCLRPGFSDIDLARLEISWLIKDAMGGKVPRGKQKGFAFVRAQVLPLGDVEKADLSIKAGLDLSNDMVLGVKMDRTIPLEHILPRLASTDKIIRSTGDSVDIFAVRDNIWDGSPFVDRSWEERAVLNIAHPYHVGKMLVLPRDECFTVGAGVDETLSVWLDSADSDDYANALEDFLRWSEGSDLIRPAAKIGRFKHELKSIGLPTGALSGMNIMVRLPDTYGDKAITLVDIAERYDLAPHHYISVNCHHYMGFKPHPLTPELKGGTFVRYDPGHELRKLCAVERARNKLRGYKLKEHGTGSIDIHLNNGSHIILSRPGMKDCEDFTIELASGGRPTFGDIFADIQRYLSDPGRREGLLSAVKDLWMEVRPYQETIRTFSMGKPDGAKYEPEELLAILYFLFIVEDLNYRFFYHKVGRRGPQRRKQGRDRVYTIIQRLAAGEELDKAVAEGDGHDIVPLPDGCT